jgi:hypothetical protein
MGSCSSLRYYLFLTSRADDFQIAYDASTAGQKADETVSCLYDAMQHIQIKANFSKHLADQDLYPVYLSALKLSATIIECLAVAISSISSKKRGIHPQHQRLTSAVVFILAVCRNTGVADAVTKVQNAVDQYIKTICSLSATTGVHLLDNQEEQLLLQRKQLALQEDLNENFENEKLRRKKEKVLDWLYCGDPWERFSELKRVQTRFLSSGKWFLESSTFEKWVTGGTQSLICWGARTLPFVFLF